MLSGNLCQSFLLSYGVRVGIGILLRAFKLVRGHSYSSLLDLKVSGDLEFEFNLFLMLNFFSVWLVNVDLEWNEFRVESYRFDFKVALLAV